MYVLRAGHSKKGNYDGVKMHYKVEYGIKVEIMTDDEKQ